MKALLHRRIPVNKCTRNDQIKNTTILESLMKQVIQTKIINGC